MVYKEYNCRGYLLSNANILPRFTNFVAIAMCFMSKLNTFLYRLGFLIMHTKLITPLFFSVYMTDVMAFCRSAVAAAKFAIPV